MFKRIAVIVTSVLLLVLFIAPKVMASVRCETQYGGGQICTTTGQLQINKKVWNQDSASWVDNMGVSDHHFVAGDEVLFDLKVTNVGSDGIDNIVVNDTLPAFLVAESGDFNFTISHLDSGASDERQIKAKVVSANNLPSDQSLICNGNTTNFVEAHTNDFSDHDSSQICVENKVLGTTTIVKTLPPTGPEDWLLIVAGLPMLGFVGYKLSNFRRG